MLIYYIYENYKEKTNHNDDLIYEREFGAPDNKEGDGEEEENVDDNKEDENIPPEEAVPEPEPKEIEISNDKIKKYLLFNKLLEIKNKISNLDFIKYDVGHIQKIIEYLTVVIEFFSVLEYDDAFKVTERIVNELDSVLKKKKTKQNKNDEKLKTELQSLQESLNNFKINSF